MRKYVSIDCRSPAVTTLLYATISLIKPVKRSVVFNTPVRALPPIANDDILIVDVAKNAPRFEKAWVVPPVPDGIFTINCELDAGIALTVAFVGFINKLIWNFILEPTVAVNKLLLLADVLFTLICPVFVPKTANPPTFDGWNSFVIVPKFMFESKNDIKRPAEAEPAVIEPTWNSDKLVFLISD